MLVIGLTGGIGSGKTTVAQLFEKQGVPLIDADLIARELTETQKPAWKKISAHFGPGILKTDHSLNRQKLREIIFNDPGKRLWLEKLLHPLITEEIQNRLQKLQAPYCIVAIPLLIETGPYPFIDRILVVDVDEATQLQRLKARDQTRVEELQKIIASQTSREKRLAEAHDLIQNNGEQNELQAKVDKLHQFYLSLDRSTRL